MIKPVWNVPNCLSLLRLLSVPALLALAWFQHPHWYIGVLIASFSTDALDGWLARWLHQRTAFGARLDTVADVAVYLTLPLGAWWLWPDLLMREWLAVAVIVLSVLLPAITGWLKFGRLTSYHTWLVKFAVVLMVVTTIALFLGASPWPFRIAAAICLLAGLEEALISLVSRRPRSDVRSLWHVLHYHRRSLSRKG